MSSSSGPAPNTRSKRIVELFHKAWQAGSRPSIEKCLGHAPADRVYLLHALVPLDLERRLAAGEAVRVEEYLRKFPELQANADSVIELLEAENRHRIERGQRPDPGEYFKRFPQLRARLFRSPLGGDPTVAPSGAAKPPKGLPAAVGRYRVDALIGSGGMGDIVRVHDGDFDRPLAMKVMQADCRENSSQADRLLREAQLTGQLQHPGIPPVQEKGTLPDGRPYFIMKLIDGQSLYDLLRERATPGDRLAYFLGVFEQICQTVAYAHTCGIIHRDLKPGNVMVGAFGEVQVMDWGLGKRLSDRTSSSTAVHATAPKPRDINNAHSTPGSNETAFGAALGTPAYMPPEQARGMVEQVDCRSDVFGLGGILCNILTGKPPYVGGRALELAKKGNLEDAFVRLDDCGGDAEVIALAKRCLAPRPTDRPSHAGEAAQEMAAYQNHVRERLRQAEIADGQAQVRIEEGNKRLAVERQKRRATTALASVVVTAALAAAGTGWWVLDRQAEQRRQADRTALAVKDDIRQAEEMQAIGRWREARQTLVKANELIGPSGDTALREQVEAARDSLNVREKLVRIGEDKMAVIDGKMDYTLAAPAYAAVFLERGFNIQEGEEDDLVGRLKQSPILKDYLAALDDWIAIEPQRDLLARLCRITGRLTDQTWRDNFPETINDKIKLDELLGRLDDGEVSPALFAGLCVRLQTLQGDGIARLEKARIRRPTEPWLHFLAATLYGKTNLKTKTDEDAARTEVQAYLTVLAIRPENVVAWNNLGIALTDAGEPQRAVVALRQAIHLDPNRAQYHNNLGKALTDAGDVDGALAVHREAIRLDPKYASPYNGIGNSLATKGDLAGAVAAYREAIRLRPDFALPYHGLGTALGRQGDHQAAVAALRDAIRLDSETAAPHNVLGNELRQIGDFAGAIASYREAIRLKPQFAGPHQGLGDLLIATGKRDAGIAEYREAIRLDPKRAAKFNHVMGNALRDKGDLDGALSAYQDAIRIDPGYAFAHAGVGMVLRSKRDLDGAIRAFRESIRLDPTFAHAHGGLAEALGAKKDRAGAIAAYRQAIKVDPQMVRAHIGLANLLIATAELDEAVACCNEGIRLDPKNAWAHLTLGTARIQQQKYYDATRAFRAAFTLDPNLEGRGAAASISLLAAAGKGKDALSLSANEKNMLRFLTLDWIRTDAARLKKAVPPNAKDIQILRDSLQRWRKNPALADFRDESALAQLPDAERQAWRQFWAGVLAVETALLEKRESK